MKKSVLVLLVTLLSISIAGAKAPKFMGAWMTEKVIVKGRAQIMFMPLTFEEDNDIISNDDVFGKWSYDAKSKLLNIKSFKVKEFNGDWKIKEVSKENMILKMGEVELFLFRYDPQRIKQINTQATLQGSWVLESKTAKTDATENSNDNGNEKTILSFKNDIDFELKIIGENYSSNQKGEWMYLPKEKSITFISNRRTALLGAMTISKKDDSEFIIENKTYRYTFKKLKTVEIEKLSFDYENLDENIDNNAQLPWKSIDQLKKESQEIKSLVYTKGIYNIDMHTFDNSTMLIKPSIGPDYGQVVFTQYEVSATDTNEIGNQEIYEELAENPFFPEPRLTYYTFLANEKISVAAGTFDCAVVIGIDDNEIKVKYWMILSKPGIYARIIKQREGPLDAMEYTLYELQAIEK